MSNTPLTRLKRKLEMLELEHLRQHVTELYERLERSERRAEYAEDCAESWHQNCMNLMQQLGREIGLTTDGGLVAIETRQTTP